MSDPYTRPPRFTTRGGSQQREEPQGKLSTERGTHGKLSAKRGTQSKLSPHLKIGEKITDHHQVVQKKNMMNLISKRRIMYKKKQQHFGLRKKQIQDDYLIEQSTSSVSATKPLGLVWSWYHLLQKGGWKFRTQWFWRTCPQFERMEFLINRSTCEVEASWHQATWLGKASLDWTSLLSLHKSLGARTLEIKPQKSSRISRDENVTRQSSSKWHRLDERTSWTSKLGASTWNPYEQLEWKVAQLPEGPSISKMTWIGYLRQGANSIRFTWTGWSGRMTCFGEISVEKGMLGMTTSTNGKNFLILALWAMIWQIPLLLFLQYPRQSFLNLKSIFPFQRCSWWWQLSFVKASLNDSFALMSPMLIESLSNL